MKSVAIPTHVVVLFKRLVNVVSTLSISHHYLSPNDDVCSASKLHAKSLAKAELSRLQTSQFPRPEGDQWASWLKNCRAESMVRFQLQWEMLKAGWSSKNVTGKDSSISSPWWSSMFSSAAQMPISPLPTPQEPPPRRERIPDPPAMAKHQDPPDLIHKLIANPALYDPLRVPRYPIALCHGLYGFDARGPTSFPSMRMHYWANVLHILRGVIGAEVIVTSVPGTGNISSRSVRLDEQLQTKAKGRGVNLLAHSMGGLDCRHLITHIKPSEYAPLSLTTIATPHRGSPFMDWCMDTIGIGKLREHEYQLLQARSRRNLSDEYPPPPEPMASTRAEGDSRTQSASSFNFASLPSSFTTLLLSVVDSPAYANLTSAYLNDVFNPATPDDPNVKYWSVAGRVPAVNIWHPFWFTKMIVDSAEEKLRVECMKQYMEKHAGSQTSNPQQVPLWADPREWGNDGLVTVQSAKWGEFLGVLDGCDHWEMRGARGIEFGVDLPALPAIGLGVSIPGVGSKAPALSPKAEASYVKEWGRFLSGWTRDTKLPSIGSTWKSEKESSPEPSKEQEASMEQRQSEFAKGDQVVRASTEKLSVVLDWLVEQIPTPQLLAGAGSLLSSNSNSDKQSDGALKAKHLDSELTEASPKAPSSSPATTAGSNDLRHIPPVMHSSEPKTRALDAEVQKLTERERKHWRKNELESKADLERFYVALSRKMWDEGL
ncbi:alpha/beta-hydrolase [Coprinopsis marcescibilis]|uniref:Alpha/beta-hydrolase n=1 Tax=Coprinopsis marcescibilis TaxID=230819 RepID=A0A5C3L4N2_COPMA|nr:alpha/beta-hydrolase [Coprinopsis marcescibilis]